VLVVVGFRHNVVDTMFEETARARHMQCFQWTFDKHTPLISLAYILIFWKDGIVKKKRPQREERGLYTLAIALNARSGQACIVRARILTVYCAMRWNSYSSSAMKRVARPFEYRHSTHHKEQPHPFRSEQRKQRKAYLTHMIL
jgi:hypothetical protein